MPLRYSFRIKNVSGNLVSCSICNGKPEGVLTDRMTGEEYWSCNACFNVKKSQRCKRRSLHIDFRKSLKKDTISCVENQEEEVKA